MAAVLSSYRRAGDLGCVFIEMPSDSETSNLTLIESGKQLVYQKRKSRFN